MLSEYENDSAFTEKKEEIIDFPFLFIFFNVHSVIVNNSCHNSRIWNLGVFLPPVKSVAHDL